MLDAIILGIVQGLSEFLPISSSGHLVLFNKLLKADADVFFYATLHLGTVLSVLFYFAKDIIRTLLSKKRVLCVIIACLITGIVAAVSLASSLGRINGKIATIGI